jgi:VWFA-related protein
MKKIMISVFLFLSCLLFLNPALLQEEHVERVVSIEVPVRVLKGGSFVSNLSIEDFELYEDGVKQEIDAVYLIMESSVKKEELPQTEQTAKSFTQPDVSRNFVLVFEVNRYTQKIAGTIDYFFEKVIKQGDSLIVMTPMKTYNLSKEALSRLPREECASQLKSKLKKEIALGSAEYHRLNREILTILSGLSLMGFDTEQQLERVHDMYKRWKDLRYMDQQNLLNFAEYLKQRQGQKHVFIFYQMDVLPQMNPKEMAVITSMSQEKPNLIALVQDLFSFFKKDVTFDEDKIQKAFSDSTIASHFIYLTDPSLYESDVTQMRSSLGSVTMSEKSSDIFKAFSDLADATGGISISSANALDSFQIAVEASENYYLVYYTPRDYKADNKFHKIEVRIKGGGYRVTHRAGYIAD